MLYKTLIAAAAALSLTACNSAAHSDITDSEVEFVQTLAEIGDRPVTGVLIHADWCPSCKIVEPRLLEAMEGISSEDFALAEIDFTDRDFEAAMAHADTLGLGDVLRAYYTEHDLGTGQVLLVHMETRQVVATLNKILPAETMQLVIESAAR